MNDNERDYGELNELDLEEITAGLPKEAAIEKLEKLKEEYQNNNSYENNKPNRGR